MQKGLMYHVLYNFTTENALLSCVSSSPTAVLAPGQLSSISLSLHELDSDTAAAQGRPDRPFAPSIFLCLSSVVAGMHNRHMHVNAVASQRTLLSW